MSKFLFVLNINTSKVDMPNSITDLNLAPVFMWLSMAPSSMNGYQKRYMFERYRTTCSKYDTRPRFNSGHNCGGGGWWTYMTISQAQESSLWKQINYLHDLQKVQ